TLSHAPHRRPAGRGAAAALRTAGQARRRRAGAVRRMAPAGGGYSRGRRVGLVRQSADHLRRRRGDRLRQEDRRRPGPAAVVGYLVLDQVFGALAPAFGSDSGDGETVINYGVLGGIIIGIVTALLYQRCRRIKLPTYLGFFGGRRFVPIVTSVAAMLIAVVM